MECNMIFYYLLNTVDIINIVYVIKRGQNMKYITMLFTLIYFLSLDYAHSMNEQPEPNFLATRKMFTPTIEYRNANQLLVIKDLSSVLEYAGRSILVVRLVDDSEVPFYRSTGNNSGLPESWLPFFGLRKDGWLHKNYTFDEDHDTHIPLNPLYHSGDYILAQAGNELDRLAIGQGDVLPNDEDGISTINYWIGGQMLEPRTMPQALKMRAKEELPFPIAEQNIHTAKEVNLGDTFSQNRFGPFIGASDNRQSVVGCSQYLTPHLSGDSWTNEHFVGEMKKAPRFIHDLMTLTQRMARLVSQGPNLYREDYRAFIHLIMESFSLYKALKPSSLSQDKLNAYLALQMLKRFSFNYAYMMLNDLTKASPSFALTEEVSSRAVWVAIKQAKKFNDQKKIEQIKAKLLEIRAKNFYCFQTLCTERPDQIVHFISDRPTVETETEADIYNEELLKTIRKIIFQIYDNPEKEIFNIKRVIEKKYHRLTFQEMVDYYQNPSHLLGRQLPGINDEDGIGAIKSALSETMQIIDGSDAEKFEKALLNVQFIEAKLNIMVEIPKVLASLRVIDLTNSDNYIIALNHLLFLKKVSQLSSLEADLKLSFQLSIEQLTTVLYMNALAHISEFKIGNRGSR